MPTIDELHSIQLRELDAVIAESELLLQKTGGLDGELKSSGVICEQFIQQLAIEHFVPSYFRVVSGYIATPELLSQKSNLPQCDLLIVDGRFPPILRFSKFGIEVVPKEAVAGILEVKRTLTQKSFGDALGHLNKVLTSIGYGVDHKVDTNLNLVNTHTLGAEFVSYKPLVGVVGLQADSDFLEKKGIEQIDELDSLVDFVWSIDGQGSVAKF